jgi:thienamycin biosynthesis protein ThnO
MSPAAVTDTAQAGIAVTAPPVLVPALVGARPVYGTSPGTLLGATGEPVVRVGSPGRLVQFQMAERAAAVSRALRGISDDVWFGLFTQAGRQLLGLLAAPATGGGRVVEPYDASARLPDVAVYAKAASATTGLPAGRVRHGWATVARDLLRMPEILAAQSPDGSLAAYRTGVVSEHGWQWRPAGRSVYVRVPANFPTITIEWLQALAARRPALLGTGADPFTSFLFADALYQAGLPDGAVSLCHGPTDTLLRLADQVLWPGPEPLGWLLRPGVKTYHNGQSKAVLTTAGSDSVFARLARMATVGCGRLCTNLSSLAVTGDGDAAARRLAAHLDAPVRPLDDPAATVPAFPNRRRRDEIAGRIEREIAAGAVDVTAELTDAPLRIDMDGAAFLRPTVLLVDSDSPLWGVELPFPFVAVARVPRSRLRAACGRSLVVALPDGDADLVEQFADEPAVDKVFAGDEFDHEYDPAEPHEGYLSEFLFFKKTVRSAAGATDHA